MGVGQQVRQGFSLNGSEFIAGLAQNQNNTFATLIAHAGGGQAAATAIPPTASIIVLGTVATVADSLVLPFAVPGTMKVIFNSSANSATIYGQVAVNKVTGVIDTINGTAGSTGYALAGGKSAILFCGKDGAWAALLSA